MLLPVLRITFTLAVAPGRCIAERRERRHVAGSTRVGVNREHRRTWEGRSEPAARTPADRAAHPAATPAAPPSAAITGPGTAAGPSPNSRRGTSQRCHVVSKHGAAYRQQVAALHATPPTTRHTQATSSHTRRRGTAVGPAQEVRPDTPSRRTAMFCQIRSGGRASGSPAVNRPARTTRRRDSSSSRHFSHCRTWAPTRSVCAGVDSPSARSARTLVSTCVIGACPPRPANQREAGR